MRELTFQYQLLIYFTERILNRSQENYSQTEYAANYYFFLSFMFLIAFDQVCPKWFNIYEINKYEFMPQASFFFSVMGFFSAGFSAAGIFLAAAFFLTRGFFWFLRPTTFFLPCHRNYYFLYELANHLTLGDFDFHWGWIVKGILWILTVLLV